MRLSLLTAVASFLGVFGAGCGPSTLPPPPPPAPPVPEFVPSTNDEHNQMLATLGFSTGLGEATDPIGRPVVDGYHPLGKRFSVFHPRSEVYLAGYALGVTKEQLFDDSAKGYQALPLTAKDDTSWTGAQFKKGVAGDFDGDGLDELFIAYYVNATQRLRYLVLDVNGAAVKEGELEAGVPLTALDERLQPSLASGDLDADGRDEVAVAFGRFYLVNALEAEPTISSLQLPEQNQDDTFVAMGNLDWDGADELAVTYTTGAPTARIGRYAIFDGQFVTPTQTGPLTLTVESVAHSARESQVAIGDVDGDRLGEVVFAGLVDGNYWGLFVLEYNRPDRTPLYDWKSFFFRPGWADVVIPRPLFVLDWNGDGIMDVFFHRYVFHITREVTPTQVDVGLGTGGWIHRVAPGDVDGDGRDEIIFESGAVYARGLNALDQVQDKKVWSGAPTHAVSTIIVPLNTDGDSPVVRYDGEHELLFTRPQLIAALASPPYRGDVGQNVDATASTFGTSTSDTVEHSTSLGFTTGFSVGYEADFGIFGGAEFNASVEQSLDFIAGASTTISKDHSYTSGPGEDKVVFTTVPFDVYYYTVVASPEARDVGRRLSINVPRESQTQSTTREFYNAHNGGGLDVDEAIFMHRAGDVFSYPTLADRNRILERAQAQDPTYHPLWNGPKPVGQGGGYDTIGISKTQGSSRSAEMGFSVKFEFSSTSPGGAKVGSSVGFQYGYSCTYSTEEAAFFQGTVGDLPAKAYQDPNNRYQYGLFVYPQAAGDQKFVVMNYWTER